MSISMENSRGLKFVGIPGGLMQKIEFRKKQKLELEIEFRIKRVKIDLDGIQNGQLQKIDTLFWKSPIDPFKNLI